MAKRSSQRRPTRHLDRAQAGCIWGLIGMFDFCNGRSTRLLFSDRKHAAGSGCSSPKKPQLSWTEKCEHVVDSDGIKIPMSDSAKTSMEVEIVDDQSSTDRPTDFGQQSDQITSKSSDNAKNNPSDDLDLEKIMEELSKIIGENYDAPCSSKKLAAAIKLVIEEKLRNSKQLRGEDFVDALQALSINKGVFLKLLQDPNSALVRNFEDAHVDEDQICRLNVLEGKLVSPGSGEFSGRRRHRSFFHRKSKSLDNYSSGGDRLSKSPHVVHKPCLPGSQSPESDIAISNSSPFSFTEIKRKLKHAMGKERGGVFPPDTKLPPSISSKKSAAGEALSWSSPNRNHFSSERFHFNSERFYISSPRSEQIGKVKEKANETSQRLRPGESNIYIEARKHLSERVDENAEPMAARLPKSQLGRILSFPEYKLSPCSSPRKYDGPTMQNLDSQSCISGLMSEENVQPHEMNVDSPMKEDQVQSLTQCATVSQEMMEPKSQQEETIVDNSSDSCRTPLDGDLQESSTCPKPDLCEDEILSSPTVSPWRPSVSLQPSPVSILEPMFTDDDVSPASSTSRSVDKQIHPRWMNFEEEPSQDVCMGISVEGEESEFEYVEAVLLGSGLNWNEFLMRWLSTDEILDSSLFDEVELFSSRPRYDQKLLFDCTNESLKEVCSNYFGCFTGTPQGKSTIRAIPSGMDLINEVWKGVERHLYQHPPQPHSLDQLVRMDLERSTKWMNLRSDIELTGLDMEEAIFSDFVDDFVISFVSDISELGFAVPQPESDATEASSA